MDIHLNGKFGSVHKVCTYPCRDTARATTLREKFQIKLAVPPSDSVLTDIRPTCSCTDPTVPGVRQCSQQITRCLILE